MIKDTVIISAAVFLIFALIIQCHGYKPTAEGFRDYFAATQASGQDPNPALQLKDQVPREKKLCENVNGNIYWGCTSIRTDDYYLRRLRNSVQN